MARRTGGGRRNVEIDDRSGFILADDGMREKLDEGVRSVEMAEIDGGEGERVMDEGDKATPFVPLTVGAEDGKIGEFWVRRRRLQF